MQELLVSGGNGILLFYLYLGVGLFTIDTILHVIGKGQAAVWVNMAGGVMGALRLLAFVASSVLEIITALKKL